MADSTGLLPLASGVMEAICDCRLLGMLAEAVVVEARCAGEGLDAGGGGRYVTAGAGFRIAGFEAEDSAEAGAEVGAIGPPPGFAVAAVAAPTGAALVDGAASVPLPAAGLSTTCTVGACPSPEAVEPFGAVGSVTAVLDAASLLGFFAVGSTTGVTRICEGSVVASGMLSATGSLYSSPARAKVSCSSGAFAGATTCGLSQACRLCCPLPHSDRSGPCQGACGAATIAQAASAAAPMIARLPKGRLRPPEPRALEGSS